MTRDHQTVAFPRHRGFWRDRRRLLWRFLVAVPLFTVFSAHGQQRPTQYQVEATYLYNFSQFVAWPATQSTERNPFNICVLGQDPFGPALTNLLADATVGGKSVTAKRIATAPEAVDCRILFISSSEQTRLKEILTTLASASVLTVSDLPEFTQRGGMVQFLLVDDRVRFEVNLAAAKRGGLTLSSELLKVATNVIRTIPAGD
ncbi:MAG: YfiR family protein [Acidobacteriaceae bacterium]